ncbi:MAG: efflux RND transporter periplasmic adaptor subunit [Candidatus Competibacteraceae bacterium]
MPDLSKHKNSLIIVAVALLLALWVASGPLTRDALEIPAREAPAPMRVAVVESAAQSVERLLTLQGEVEPDQVVTVRAETAGRVVEIPVALSEVVSVGQVIARLAMDDREARLRRAEAAVKGRETDYRGAQQLAREGLQAQLRVESALAELEAGRAELETVRLEIAQTRISAPIAGILDRRRAEVGDYVAVGDPVAEVLENNPLRAVVQVPQHRVHQVRPGGSARVVFLDGTVREGKIHYIAARAETATRTFRVEIRIPNPDRTLPSGISARVEIPVETVRAHRVSPALVTLDDRGRLGVKTVDEEERVAFHPIDPMRADVEGLWVTGLPERARVITVGQGFVNAGDPVRVTPVAAGTGTSP